MSPSCMMLKEADLDFTGQVGKFVDGENAAIGAGQKAVVNGEFVGEIATATSRANGVDVTDDVGDGDIGSGELFDVALVARKPGDRSIVAFGGDAFAAGAANGTKGIVVDFAARDDGDFRVEKLDQAAQDAALRLAAQTEQR